MRKLFLTLLALCLVGSVVGYGIWTQQRPVGHYLSDLRVSLALNHGLPNARGNLLGIEPLLFPSDYQQLSRLQRKLTAYLDSARQQGLVTPRTVVVLPEHIGTWLWARGEKPALYQTTQLREAWQWLELSNPVHYGVALLRATGEDRRTDAHLRMKAAQMAADYQQVFGGLARAYGVTLVAGSIVLPAPYVADGRLQVGNGPLFNASVVFSPEGAIVGQPQRQRYPDSEVRRFIAGDDARPQVYETPLGRLAVLVGSDSWYTEPYRQLSAAHVQVLANPVFLRGKDSWDAPWRGNRHQPAAAALPVAKGEASEAQAWRALTRLANPGLPNLSVFLRGQFWEQGGAGQGFATLPAAQVPSTPSAGARLLNVWL